MGTLASHQLANQTSFDTDIHTPIDILDMAREVMGSIDVDPASSAAANERVRAKTFYTESSYDVVGRMEHDGMPIRQYADWGGISQAWEGNVWMNPPFGTPDSACKSGCTKKRCAKRGWHTSMALPGMADWIDRFIEEYTRGVMTQGICITFAATSEGWFQPLMPYPVCFPRKRTNYLLPDGTVYRGVTKGSCCHYLGPNLKRFAEVFSRLGAVKVLYAS